MAVKRGEKMARDYTYDTEYEASEEQKRRRARRNRDRRRAISKGIVIKGDGKDIHHKNKNDLSWIQVISASKNRAMK